MDAASESRKNRILYKLDRLDKMKIITLEQKKNICMLLHEQEYQIDLFTKYSGLPSDVLGEKLLQIVECSELSILALLSPVQFGEWTALDMQLTSSSGRNRFTVLPPGFDLFNVE